MNYATPEQIATIACHFLIAAVWADAPEGTNPRVTKKAEAEALARCAAFVNACGPLFTQAMAVQGYGSHPDAGSPEAAFGHDFYMTSQGHGVGFRDRYVLECKPLHTLAALDRNGKPYATSGETLGEVLANIAYGTNAAISPFAYKEPYFYRGWMYL